MGLRFAVATAVLLAFRPRGLRGLDRRILATDAVLGVLLGGGLVLATVGMQTTSVVVSAFVIGTTVAFVPLVGWVWLQRRLSRRTAVAVALATAGLGLITVRVLAFALELPPPAGPELMAVPSSAAWLGLLTLEPVTGAILGLTRGEALTAAFALGAAAVLVAATLVARAR